ncbi:Hypothetical protein PHPALM_5949 [Phytophthora palmivora]|uniref:Uncharacterized protein n=1 Tax=Phytophthora palmivora TaxID=4796 RepID=A0A2P4YG62_9STRA|nr:Hypothetical protein PHPALM_5949 [Phytophthora palmivora]
MPGNPEAKEDEECPRTRITSPKPLRVKQLLRFHPLSLLLRQIVSDIFRRTKGPVLDFSLSRLMLLETSFVGALLVVPTNASWLKMNRSLSMASRR